MIDGFYFFFKVPQLVRAMLLPFTHCRICFVVHTIVRCDPAAEDAENSDEAADEEESATGGWQG
jgi:hypothetical protein